jgi:hypothetical protein
MRRLFPAVLLLTGSVALADSPLPGSDVRAPEVVTRTAAETPKADEELRMLRREVQALKAEVQRLQPKVTDRPAIEAEFFDQPSYSYQQ